MGMISVDIMPPAYWQDFERLTLDIVKRKWNNHYAERNGRQGQAQSGVDVYGYNFEAQEHTGVQCKKRTWLTKPGADAPSNSLTTSEIDAEILAARSFTPALDRFIIATTGPRDDVLQNHVRNLIGNAKPAISLMFWDDYVEHLNNDTDLMYRYYEGVLKYRETYSPDEHYYRLLYMAFDRPAIRTQLMSENGATDLLLALAQTQAAISTGVLKDREDRIIDQARVPKSRPNELKQAAKKLQQARELVTRGLAGGDILMRASYLEIRDVALCNSVDTLRFESVEMLNNVLRSKGLEALPS